MALLPPALLASLLFASCGGGGSSSPTTPPDPTPPGPVPTECASVAGQWTSTWDIPACGADANGSSPVTITANGCLISFVVPGLGEFSGAIDAAVMTNILTVQYDPAAPGSDDPDCTAGGSSGLEVTSENQLDAIFGDGGGAACCRAGGLQLTR